MANEIIKKNDFVELEFLGKNLTNNEIFDTNMPQEAKKIGLQTNPRPLLVCVGKGMIVKGFDEALEGKEIGKKYSVEVSPENGFGKRQPNLTRMIPTKFFLAQKIAPQPGMTLALDNNLVKIVSVSGGRVMVDFNNPLAGKEIEYEFIIKRLVSDPKEKVLAVQRFLFGQEFEFDVDETRKMIIFKDVKLIPILNVFRPKFKEFLDMDIEIFAKKEDDKKEEAKEVKA
jgi:FKBP-type peptidyl-prolyl cis-trans isomerase 2